MSEQFSVGEIAIVQNAHPIVAHLNGTECEVLEVFSPPLIDEAGNEVNYIVLAEDGNKYGAGRHHLRKKRPPTEYTGELRIMELFTKPPVVQPEPEECA